jgi:hypothetical protein
MQSRQVGRHLRYIVGMVCEWPWHFRSVLFSFVQFYTVLRPDNRPILQAAVVAVVVNGCFGIVRICPDLSGSCGVDAPRYLGGYNWKMLTLPGVKVVSDCCRSIKNVTFAFLGAFCTHNGRILAQRRIRIFEDARKHVKPRTGGARRVPTDGDGPRFLARSHCVRAAINFTLLLTCIVSLTF